MDTSLIVACIGVVSVLASALVQYKLGRLNERSKKEEEVRTQAYLDFVNVVSEIASSSNSGNKSVDGERHRKLVSSKSRVVLLGSDQVVRSVSDFFCKHQQLSSAESYKDFTLVIMAMRKDVSVKNRLKSDELEVALFGKN
ncbi:hypothetical protein [Aeromonas caviae]|uniref:hypothetical protein n=1 Tax=Aeromonas caviae TaxID=648 RepID=UPI0009BC5C61|nr:hypothetical protein [Aeromonas caviae]ATP89898.1 hypothetical protein VI35_05695 [Aeromonas caviae]MBL0516637.1 hypothetical protein [Aeromonas caviae]MBS4706560.1 hypothetical protein [Aeromonas caviae]MDX7790993.1 hypothetical protein [Aeromonas caviae]